MKSKLLLALSITIFYAATLKAQINRDDIILGATAGYVGSGANSGSYSSSNANLSPRIAWGVGKNATLGVKTNLGFQTDKSEDNSITKTTRTTVGAGLFFRKYLPFKGQIGWYIEPGAAYTYTRYKYNYSDPSIDNPYTKSNQFSVDVTPGIYYTPIPKLFITASFGGVSYSHATSKNNGNKQTSSSFYLNLLNSFNFGIDFVLGKKQ